MVGTRGKVVQAPSSPKVTAEDQIRWRKEADEKKALETARHRSNRATLASLHRSSGAPAEDPPKRELVTEIRSQRVWQSEKWSGVIGLGVLLGSWKPCTGDPGHFQDFETNKVYRGSKAPLAPAVSGYHVKLQEGPDGPQEWLHGKWEYGTSWGSSSWTQNPGALDTCRRRLWTRQISRTVYSDSLLRKGGGVKVMTTEELEGLMKSVTEEDTQYPSFEGQLKDIKNADFLGSDQILRFTLLKNTLTSYDHYGNQVQSCSLDDAELELWNEAEDEMPQIAIKAKGSNDLWILEFSEGGSTPQELESAHIMKSVWFIKMHYSMHHGQSAENIPVSKPDLRRVPSGPHTWLTMQAVWVPNTQHYASYIGDNAHLPSSVADKSLDTYWQADKKSEKAWIIVDLQKPAEVSSFVYYNVDGSPCCPRKCRLTYGSWPKAKSWCVAHEWTGDQKEGFSAAQRFSPKVARYWKFEVESTYGSKGCKIALLMLRGTQQSGGDGATHSHQAQGGYSIEEKRERWSDAATHPELWSDAQWVFDSLDVNNDGTVNGQEFKDWYLLSGCKDFVINSNHTGGSTVTVRDLDSPEEAGADGEEAPAFKVPRLLPEEWQPVDLDCTEEVMKLEAVKEQVRNKEIFPSAQEDAEKELVQARARCFVSKKIREDNLKRITQHFDDILDNSVGNEWKKVAAKQMESEKLQVLVRKLKELMELQTASPQPMAPGANSSVSAEMLYQKVTAMKQDIDDLRKYLHSHKCGPPNTYSDEFWLNDREQNCEMFIADLLNAAPARDEIRSALKFEIELAEASVSSAAKALLRTESCTKNPVVGSAFASQEVCNLIHKSLPADFWEKNPKYLPHMMMPRLKRDRRSGTGLPQMDLCFYLREEQFDQVLSEIKLHAEDSEDKEFHYWLTFVPTYSVEFIVNKWAPRLEMIDDLTDESNNLVRRIHPTHLGITMVPEDRDLISLEINHDMRKIELEEQGNVASIVASSIGQLDELFRPAMNTAAKGDTACAAMRQAEVVRNDRKDFTTPENLLAKSVIGHLMLLDRSCDMVTPMLTQATYGGMIHELFQSTKQVRAIGECPADSPFMTGQDSIWVLLRDLPIHEADRELLRMARQQQELIDKVKQMKQKNANTAGSVRATNAFSQIQAAEAAVALQPLIVAHSNIARFILDQLKCPSMVKQLYDDGYPELVAAAEAQGFFDTHTHVNLYEESFLQLHEFVRNVRYSRDPDICNEYFLDSLRRVLEIKSTDSKLDQEQLMLRAIRLLCLMSLTSGGLEARHEARHKKEIIAVCGYKGWLLCRNLMEASGLSYTSTDRSWERAVNVLQLTNDWQPAGSSACKIFGNMYAPLSVRLVEDFSNHRWLSDASDLNKLVLGATKISHHDEEADYAYLKVASGANAEDSTDIQFTRQDTGRAGWLETRDVFYFNRWAVLQGDKLLLYKKPADVQAGKPERERIVLSDYTFEVEKGVIHDNVAQCTQCVFLLKALPESESFAIEETIRLRVKAEDAKGWRGSLSHRCTSLFTEHGGVVANPNNTNSDIRLPYVVFFLGGITSSEISALRELGKEEMQRPERQHIVITTSVMSGNQMLKSLMADFDDESI